jgi:hypothetical protein
VHIRAAEVVGAKGRYIVSTADTVTPKWFAACVAKQFPTRFPKLQKVGCVWMCVPVDPLELSERVLGSQPVGFPL